jgi:hypothetical protein
MKAMLEKGHARITAAISERTAEMSNDHVESDIALLLMELENEDGDPVEIYKQIHDIFQEMHADGDEIPMEFQELEKELKERFSAVAA